MANFEDPLIQPLAQPFVKLLESVTVNRVNEHLAAFQAIADENEGTRASGTAGYDASVEYVKQTLEEAGYNVELQEFAFEFFPLATLAQTGPTPSEYTTGAFTGSGPGIVEGNVIPVDLALGTPEWPADPATSTSGCEASDFEGLDFSGPNDIALIQRGSCFFSVKAANAEAAGAEAVIIFNQGNTDDRKGLIVGDATTFPDGTPSNLGIPVVGASFADGVALAQSGSQAQIVVEREERITHNVLAELPGMNGDEVVMVGAHLDSVQEGPGIQDNGSASAAILEIAVQMSQMRTKNTVRFAWWGAEELGLLGSQEYVDSLSPSELNEIALYLNFDMIASPNYIYSIYDGDDSDGVGAGPGPEGSAEIEQVFEGFYTDRGIPFKGTDFDGRSDYAAFINEDIPAGGIFTGAEGIKTEEEADIWGGTAGEQYDPCYHLACDTIDNVSLEALDVNSDAIAFATLEFAEAIDVPATLALNPVDTIDENDFALLTGTYWDPDLGDAHLFTVDWDDPNNPSDSQFSLGPINTLTVGATFSSTTGDDALLTITSVDPGTGAVGFSVEHQYLDDGPAPGNGTSSDTSTIKATVADDDFSSLINNAGFETGDSMSWSTTGSTAVVDSTFGSGPSEGTWQASLDNGDGAVTNLVIESFLGLSPGSLDIGGNATKGSAIKQTVTVAAGTELSFDFNFLTDEATPPFSSNDFAFVSISAPTDQALVTADTNSDFVLSLTAFAEETGYGTFQYTFAQGGTFDIGFGVMDMDKDNTDVDSGLLVDNLTLAAAASEDVLVKNVDPTIETFALDAIESDDDGLFGDDEGVLITGVLTGTDPGTLDILNGDVVFSDGSSAALNINSFVDGVFTASFEIFIDEDYLEDNFPEGDCDDIPGLDDDCFLVSGTASIMDDDTGIDTFDFAYFVGEEGGAVLG